MRAWFLPSAVVLTLSFVLLSACGRDAPEPTPVSQKPEKKTSISEDAPVVVVLGDSLAAGIHLAEDAAFPALSQAALAKKGVEFRLINAGSSGDTTAGGLRRVDWLLKQKPDIVIVELGGNDGLRGKSLDEMKRNLDGILEKVKAAGARPLLIGMRIPTSYGEDYTEAFARVYDDLAKKHGCDYLPFFMEDIGGKPEFFLEDALHPNEEGHRLLAKRLTPKLDAMLREQRAASGE